MTAPQAPQPLAPLQGMALVLATIALSLATFMQVLDTTIANVSIPSIAGDLGVSANQGTWVITSFGVANAIAVPLTGWLAQRIGQVRLFLYATLGFVVASILCGLASSLGLLVAARVIQGAVAGPMIPLSQALLLACYPPQKRGTALALWSMTTVVAPICGPILGGWISDNWSWPWIFYINAPVGLIACYVTWRVLKGKETATRKLPIDGVGLALLMVWVGALQILLDKGKELDWFESPAIITLAVVTVLGFAYFLIWELTEKHPIVDLSLFKGANFTVGAVGTSLGYGVFFGGVVVMPLWLQTQMGYTATWAGLVTAPVGLLSVLLSPIVGKTMHKVDPRIYASLAFIILGVVSYLRACFNSQADVATIVLPQIINGAGMALFFIPLVGITLSGLHTDQVANASGLSNFMRIVAGSFGTSLSTTLWDRRDSLHHVRLEEHLTAYSPTVTQTLDQLNGLGLSPDQSRSMLERLLAAQSSMLGANEFFWLSAVLFLCLLPVVWFAKPPFTAGGHGGGEH